MNHEKPLAETTRRPAGREIAKVRSVIDAPITPVARIWAGGRDRRSWERLQG
ncbi:MAG: hypothetical protein BroJett030_10100 [Alphaproteobacteria bacterium]|nr:MAG: hypothetical protein BroJett030_10100 [Alphaproteobacteria bacterium]